MKTPSAVKMGLESWREWESEGVGEGVFGLCGRFRPSSGRTKATIDALAHRLVG